MIIKIFCFYNDFKYYHKKILMLIDIFFLAIGIPLFLKKGIIGSFFLQIPWTKIWTQPCKVIFEDVHMLIETIDHFDEKFYKNRKIKKKSSEIKKINKEQIVIIKIFAKLINIFNKKVEDQPKPIKPNKNYLKKLNEIVFANLQLEIKNFHLRLENDGTILLNRKFAFGIVLDRVTYGPTDHLFQRNFFVDPDKQKLEKQNFALLEIIDFGIYLEKNETGSLLFKIN